MKELLFNKGVGRKLCKMFKSYWHPNIMMKYLEQTAMFTQSRESSLNLTDAVQTKFHLLFTEFMIVMVITECNLDIFFGQEKIPELQELFLSLLENVKLPKLDELTCIARSQPQARPQELYSKSTFPFFRYTFTKCLYILYL